MKVLHVIFQFTVGGAETMLVDIANEQCKTADVYILIINDQIYEQLLQSFDKRVTIILINRKRGNKIQLISTFFKIQKLLSSIKPDAIHCHNNNLIYLFPFHREKTCVTVHSVNLSNKYLSYYGKIFAISKAVKIDLKERSNIESVLVYNGIKLDDFKQRIKYNFNPTLDEFKIIQIGRLSARQKAQDIAIKSISILAKTNPEINIQIYFLGEGESLEMLQKLAEDYQVNDKVTFMGLCPYEWVKCNLHNYSLLIHPSTFEGFGLTVIEGFASGLPVIAGNVDGPKEILEQLNAGLLVQPSDPEDLANKIRTIANSYISGEIDNSNYIIQNREELNMFDVKTTANRYLENYK